MSKVLVPLAQGFEDMEAVTITDILRRAGIEVTTAGLSDGMVTGSRGTAVLPDSILEDILDNNLDDDFDMIVLPGGQPGATNLKNDQRIIKLIKKMSQSGKYLAAICAAPSVLAQAGVLENKQATAFPGTFDRANFPGIAATDDVVVTDGKIITSRGPGTAIEFSLQLVNLLVGKKKADEVEKTLVRS